MAYPDYGAFLPTEALYAEPGAYSGVLKGEALKRASYLSEMDRFYEELRESSERFEKQYALSARELGLAEEQTLWEREFAEEQMEMGREQTSWEREFAEEQMEMGREQTSWEREFAEEQMELTGEQFGFEKEQTLWERKFAEEQFEKKEEFEKARLAHEEKITRIGSASQREVARLQHDLGMEQLGFQKEVEEKQLSEREEWDIASSYLSKMISPTSTKISLTEEQKNAPIIFNNRTTEVQTKSPPTLDKFGFKTY